jgi:hypothetical protein
MMHRGFAQALALREAGKRHGVLCSLPAGVAVARTLPEPSRSLRGPCPSPCPIVAQGPYCRRSLPRLGWVQQNVAGRKLGRTRISTL